MKKLFVDDVDSLEVLLAHSMPEGIANLMVPIAVYVAMFFVDWNWAAICGNFRWAILLPATLAKSALFLARIWYSLKKSL